IEHLTRQYFTDFHSVTSVAADSAARRARDLPTTDPFSKMRCAFGKIMALLPSPPAKYKGWLIAGVAALLLCVVAAICGDHGLVHLLRMRGEQRDLERMAFDLGQRNEQLRERVRRLQSDDRYIEKLARERLGLAKKGELIYRVLPQSR